MNLSARAGLCLGAFAIASWSAPVTFYKDVAPILQNRCQGCHRTGDIAPMPLVTYKDARPWARAIRAAVIQRKMPPWSADAAIGTLGACRKGVRHAASERGDALGASIANDPTLERLHATARNGLAPRPRPGAALSLALASCLPESQTQPASGLSPSSSDLLICAV